MARKHGKDRGLFQRPKDSGIWWIRYHNHRGKERREKIGSKSRAKEAYLKRKEQVRLIKKGLLSEETLMPQQCLTLGEYIETLKPALEIQKSGKDQLRFARIWAGKIGHLRLDEVSAEHAKKRQQARLQKGLKPASINRETTFLRMVMNRALEENLIQVNPISRVKNLPEKNIRDRFLSELEELRLEPEMEPEDFELVAFALDTGLRRGEQFGLTWTNVRFEDEGWVTLEDTKSGYSRSVPLTSRALEILKRRYAVRRSHFVFPDASGNQMSAHNFVHRRFRPALKRAQIEGINWHSLRHTCGSRLALAGKSLQQIGQILGHRNSKTTERYSHLLPDSARATIRALEDRSPSGLRVVK